MVPWDSVLKKKLLNYVFVGPVNSVLDSQKKTLPLENELPKGGMVSWSQHVYCSHFEKTVGRRSNKSQHIHQAIPPFSFCINLLFGISWQLQHENFIFLMIPNTSSTLTFSWINHSFFNLLKKIHNMFINMIVFLWKN